VLQQFKPLIRQGAKNAKSANQQNFTEGREGDEENLDSEF
jgi:hypothetical protein